MSALLIEHISKPVADHSALQNLKKNPQQTKNNHIGFEFRLE